MVVVVGLIVAFILLIILWNFVRTVIWLGVVSVVLFGVGWLLGYMQGSKRETE